MTVLPILPEINDIFEENAPATWELSFNALDIFVHYHDQLHKRIPRDGGCLLLHTQSNSQVAQMEVMDHLMFSFDLSFAPTAQDTYVTPIQNLASPLGHGTLGITKNILSLSFAIEPLDKVLRVKYQYGALWFVERVG